MKIGVVSEKHKYVIDRLKDSGYCICNFTISLDDLSFFQIFHSAFATPARYVMEVFRRLSTVGEESPIFVFNPLFDPEPHIVNGTLFELKKMHGCQVPVVFSDAEGYPVGYYFPQSFPAKDAQFLPLLSTVSAALDGKVLSKIFFTEAATAPVPGVYLNTSSNNGFSSSEKNRAIYRWTAENALDVLIRSTTDEVDVSRKASMRDSIPFSAIMPYHAGDVLFFAIGARNTDTRFTQVVVNSIYADIIAETLPEFKAIIIKSSPPFRAGKNIPDEDYFNEIMEEIPKESFYYYCRPSREYRISIFHLIDHVAFALGASFIDSKDLIINTRPNPPVHRPLVKRPPFRVLLHFDGGWPLKIYPPHLQKKLIELLVSKRFEVTVLCSEEKVHENYRSVNFKNLVHFKELLSTHHILVGMDSFPCHYAAHVFGLPTICLFSSTRPENSNARKADHYSYLEAGLSCRPCFFWDRCHERANEYCDNFVPAEAVFNETISMLEKVYPQSFKKEAFVK